MKKNKILSTKELRLISFACFIALLMVILLLVSTSAKSQSFDPPKNFGIFGAKMEYSNTFNQLGAGFFGGYKAGNNYIGADTHIFFKRARNVPVIANLEYGYSIGQLQPFIIGGFYTCGGEAVKENEGKQGFLYGGGISYLPDYLPIKIQLGYINENSYLSIGYYKNL